MFSKILIANRGEIAVRIIATCREMGIRTVAVYSEADRNALHVREADEAFFIGPAPAAQSYLQIETIIDVAKRSVAQAIHPGYGFLSENTAFVEACSQAEIVFIGPPASAMRLMGSKIAAKQLAISVDAPVVPGYNSDTQDDTILLREAERIGFPLLIKASAGGGGKGMREVHTPTDFRAQLEGARREALAAFGDGTVFLERLIQRPRHVEIQVLGDTFGKLIHLGERECSIQRRHQKILEESPSVALTPTLRAEMGATAVRIAKAAGYVNAGTIEFILDADKRFFFLEMNTRLQVEHPVTELVTGIDLVRHQLLIAAGEPLTLNQEQISPRGHAIEMRLYAEDPDQGFLPSTGTVTRFIKPGGPGIRIDSGIESGDEITQFYDPMIAKFIVYGEDRPAAIARLQKALERSAVFGVRTNASLLSIIAAHPAFQEGRTYTSFLLEHSLISDHKPQKQGKQGKHLSIPKEALIAAALHEFAEDAIPPAASNMKRQVTYPAPITPWMTLGPWRMIGEARRVTYTYNSEEHSVALRKSGNDADEWIVQIDALPAEKITWVLEYNSLVLLRQGTAQVQAYVQSYADRTEAILHGHLYPLKKLQPPYVDNDARGSHKVQIHKIQTASMTGTIVKVQTNDGDEVEHCQVLVILSAMKMEHTITAPYAGKVLHVHYREGAVVKGGATLIEME